jgi:hypothetical protein
MLKPRNLFFFSESELEQDNGNDTGKQLDCGPVHVYCVSDAIGIFFPKI